ncbi:flavin reductase family protein [Cytobacillus pseudoceanisediminis]|uniref:flavin reductase family protein n=1 Tax=Cytobacillus pseudoceanisediminis TaxID=3051614 RepID=UPI003C2F912E
MQLSNKIDAFKAIMGNYPTGVTIVTTIDAENNLPVGLTVNSFTSVSISPILVLFCVDKGSSSLSSFKNSKKFAVNVLASDQEKECLEFASKNTDKFKKVNYKVSERGLPILESSLGVMECKLVNELEAGDHFVFIGEVEHINKEAKDPMVYCKGKVGSLSKVWLGE